MFTGYLDPSFQVGVNVSFFVTINVGTVVKNTCLIFSKIPFFVSITGPGNPSVPTLGLKKRLPQIVVLWTLFVQCPLDRETPDNRVSDRLCLSSVSRTRPYVDSRSVTEAKQTQGDLQWVFLLNYLRGRLFLGEGTRGYVTEVGVPVGIQNRPREPG